MKAAVQRLNPSIDDMANDARRLAGDRWENLFRRMLHAYGWQVKQAGGAILTRDTARLSDGWDITRCEAP